MLATRISLTEIKSLLATLKWHFTKIRRHFTKIKWHFTKIRRHFNLSMAKMSMD